MVLCRDMNGIVGFLGHLQNRLRSGIHNFLYKYQQITSTLFLSTINVMANDSLITVIDMFLDLSQYRSKKLIIDTFLLCVIVLFFGWDFFGVIYYSTIPVITFWTSEHTTMFLTQKRYNFLCIFY